MLSKLHNRLLLLVWTITASLTAYNWATDVPVNRLTVVTTVLSVIGAMAPIYIRYIYTRDIGWFRLMIPFGMIGAMALFGYVHYLLLLVTQVTAIFIIYLNARHAHS